MPTTEETITLKSEIQENEEKSKEAKLNIESIATVARASSDGPSLPSPAAIGQLIDTVSQMVDSDIRTPPKLKEIIKEKSNENKKDGVGEISTSLPYTFIYDDETEKPTDKNQPTEFSEGKASNINMKVSTDEGVKGIAIPVVMDDDEPISPSKKLQKIPEVPKPMKEIKKTAMTKIHPTTTPSSGLSTWILLSDNKDITTPSPKKNNKKESDEKKKPVTTVSTTKKPTKVQVTTLKTSTTQASKKGSTKLTGIKKVENDTSSMSALEALVKNQKKTQTTTFRPKVEDIKVQKKTTDTKNKVDRIDTAETKDKFEIELPESKTTYTLPTNLPLITMVSDKNPAPTETSVEGTTKKKTSSKKKKKNKNRRRKPVNDTGVEPKIPQPAVGSQIYNFISREIVPTVGLGLIGVALTAGLASFLGYNPFVSSTVPLRRTYESHHGYSPNYYNYNNEYSDGGQSEEVLFREVLSGMPEDSRYGLTRSEYPEAYNRQDQTYKNSYSTGNSAYNSEKDSGSYDATYPQDYSSAYGSSYDAQDKNIKDKYPVYSRETGTSFVYPDTTGITNVGNDYSTSSSVDKYSKTSDTIERQQEALYRVAGESELQYRNGESTIQGVNSQSSWHRMGSALDSKKPYPHIEPGPRSLDLDKTEQPQKRVKRGTESVIQRISRKRTKKQNDVENEIDFDDSVNDNNIYEGFSTTSSSTTYSVDMTTATKEIGVSSPSTTEYTLQSTTEDLRDTNTESNETYEPDESTSGSSAVSVLDVLKRLAQFKLRLGLSFLRSTTDMFSRYLDDIQRKVDENFTNTTTTQVQYNRRKSPWMRIFSRWGDTYRRKRSVLDEHPLLSAALTEDNERTKSMKKELSQSIKIFHQKKTTPKKYQSNRTN